MAQVVLALAVAEKALQFEHRDLHWGNVLITRLPYTDSTAQCHMEGMALSAVSIISVSIIDFSLSRISKDWCSMFYDLSKDFTLFEFKGDYVFDIYRNMRQEHNNSWKEYHPYTNVLWLHYFVDKLLRYPKYPDSSINEHHRIISHFKTFLSVALDCDSAYDLFTECMFTEFSFFDDIISCGTGVAQVNEGTISQNSAISFHPDIPSSCSYQPPSPQAFYLLVTIDQPYNLCSPMILSYPFVESPSSCPFFFPFLSPPPQSLPPNVYPHSPPPHLPLPIAPPFLPPCCTLSIPTHRHPLCVCPLPALRSPPFPIAPPPQASRITNSNYALLTSPTIQLIKLINASGSLPSPQSRHATTIIEFLLNGS